MIFDEYKASQISIPRTGSKCVFRMLNKLPHDDSQSNFERCAGHASACQCDLCVQKRVESFYDDLGVGDDSKVSSFYQHRHFTYRDWEDFIGEYNSYENHKVFSFVRNPYDRTLSIFYFLHRNMTFGASEVKALFSQFCESCVTDDRFDLVSSWKRQTDFLINHEGKVSLDFIGSLENLEQDWIKLQKKFDFPPYNPEYRKVNKSKNRRPEDYNDFYDQRSKDIIYDFLKEDFVNFGYKR